MIIPEFIRFYGYTASQTLNEYAIRFFTLVNSMYQMQAAEMLNNITTTSVAMSDSNEAKAIVTQLQRAAKGLQAIVEEVRNIKPN